MITVIIQGTKNIKDTLKSLEANSTGKFRVFVDESVRESLSKKYSMEFVKPTLFRKYGAKSDLYWVIPSGGLVLVASWDKRLHLCVHKQDRVYCLLPSGGTKHWATNVQRNVGRWKGAKYIVPILQVTGG